MTKIWLRLSHVAIFFVNNVPKATQNLKLTCSNGYPVLRTHAHLSWTTIQSFIKVFQNAKEEFAKRSTTFTRLKVTYQKNSVQRKIVKESSLWNNQLTHSNVQIAKESFAQIASFKFIKANAQIMKWGLWKTLCTTGNVLNAESLFKEFKAAIIWYVSVDMNSVITADANGCQITCATQTTWKTTDATGARTGKITLFFW